MDYIYNTYCMLNMLFDKGASYMSNQEIIDYQTTKRIFGENASGTSVLYDLSHKATKFFNRIFLGNAYNARNFYELEKQNVEMLEMAKSIQLQLTKVNEAIDKLL